MIEEYQYIEPTPAEKIAMLLELLGFSTNTPDETVINEIEIIEQADQELNKLAHEAGGSQNLKPLTGWLEKLRTMKQIDRVELFYRISDYKKIKRLPPWNI